MKKEQISAILSELGEKQDTKTGFENSKLSYINISEFENISVQPDQRQFLFNSSTEMLEVYPCIKEDNQEIYYLKDENGKEICDYYSYEAIHFFQFKR